MYLYIHYVIDYRHGTITAVLYIHVQVSLLLFSNRLGVAVYHDTFFLSNINYNDGFQSFSLHSSAMQYAAALLLY